MVRIKQSVLDEMIMAAEAQAEECCGFFLGHDEAENRLITKSIKVQNSEPTNRSFNFKITSWEYLQAESCAEENKLSLLGIYHSHPNYPAIPSEFDRLAAQPYFSYIIISTLNGKFDAVRCWQLDTQFQFSEEQFDIH